MMKRSLNKLCALFTILTPLTTLSCININTASNSKYEPLSEYKISTTSEPESINKYWTDISNLMNNFDIEEFDKVSNFLIYLEDKIYQQDKILQTNIDNYQTIVNYLNLDKRLFMFDNSNEKINEIAKELSNENEDYAVLAVYGQFLLNSVIINENNKLQLNLFKDTLRYISFLNFKIINENKTFEEQFNELENKEVFESILNNLISDIVKMLNLKRYYAVNEEVIFADNKVDYQSFYKKMYLWLSQNLLALYFNLFNKHNTLWDSLFNEQKQYFEKYLNKKLDINLLSDFETQTSKTLYKQTIQKLKNQQIIYYKNENTKDILI
ncbi:Uncharacterised protein [Mycoplasmopsis columboralis]|uniref:Lipoprotein n=2 Tax=Mycoplasmopsis columboralis TaxID=171282 RepID=A0A449B5I0_9BACT|nr:Uncharacterised protein [Mycoplasmopsis columboralis]